MKIIYLCAAYIHDFKNFIAQVKRRWLVFRIGTGLGQIAWVYAKGTNLYYMTAEQLIINYAPGTMENYDELLSTRDIMMNGMDFDDGGLFDDTEKALLENNFKFVVIGNSKFWWVLLANTD